MKRKTIDQQKLEALYEAYCRREITKAAMAEQLGITVITLNKRLKEYLASRDTDSTQPKEVCVDEEPSKASPAFCDTNEKSLQVFTNKEFGSVRTLTIDGEPWFVGKDVAEALGYAKARNAIASHVDLEDKKDAPIQGDLGGIQSMTIINESGLYSLILSSKLPTAKKFKRWITSEVIPSIRKHGAYMTPKTLEQTLLSPDFLLRLAEKLKEEQEKNKQLEAVNAALVGETNAWDNRTLITHLIRKYGWQQYKQRFGLAWNDFYKNLNYKLHINVNARLAAQDSKEKKALDMLRDSEWVNALKIAVAMCEGIGIDTADIIGKHSLQTEF